MRYIIRAIKYFIYITVFFMFVLALLVILGVVSKDPAVMFKNGYDSFWQIALMFGAVSLVYPRFGYMKKGIVAPGEFEETRPILVEYMEERGYKLASEENKTLVFIHRNWLKRLFRVWEDQITIQKEGAGYEFEGLRRDVIRVGLGFEHKLRQDESN